MAGSTGGKLAGSGETAKLEQSQYREVPRWGVSNGARHNWKYFLAYKKFKVFLKNFICLW